MRLLKQFALFINQCTFILLVDAAASAIVAASSTDTSRSSPDAITSSLDTSKFESFGPTMTITFRDPFVPLLDNSHSRSNPTSQVVLGPSANSERPPMSIDSSFNGLAAKLAARFHINSSASSTSEPPTKSQFPDGYMIDGGNIILGPPSDSTHDKSTRQFFPLLGSFGRLKSWSACVQSVQPELAYEIKTRGSSSFDGDENSNTDLRPFPESLPWLNAVSCGLKWRPFPTYKPGDGYGHKLMSVPHHVRCGATISLPCAFWRSDVKGDDASERVSKKRNLDVDVTYLDNSTRKGGRLEVLLGRSTPYLKPQLADGRGNLQNNHILACFATGTKKDNNTPPIPALISSIEYLRASFRVPVPSFLRRNRSIARGVSVSPSYDFVDRKARLVLSGGVGTSGRTSAVLRLDSDDSTLTIVRALDEYKVIAPSISLQTGKIVYDWYVGLSKNKNGHSTSSIRTHVDPTNGIRVVWTDSIADRAGGSCWISEVRVPLGTSAPGSRLTDIRVGRRWVI